MFLLCHEMHFDGRALLTRPLFSQQISVQPSFSWPLPCQNGVTHLSATQHTRETPRTSLSPHVRRFRLQTVLLPSAGGCRRNLGLQSVHLMQLHAQGTVRLQLHGTAAPHGGLQPGRRRARPSVGGQRQQQWPGALGFAAQPPQGRQVSLTHRGGRGDEEQRLQRQRDRVARQWKSRQRQPWQREQRTRVSGELQRQQQRLGPAGIVREQQEVSAPLAGN